MNGQKLSCTEYPLPGALRLKLGVQLCVPLGVVLGDEGALGGDTTTFHFPLYLRNKQPRSH